MLILVIGIAEWPQYARTVRANVLAEKEKEYVDAARVIGLSRLRIMFRHILPNTLTPILVISTVQVANAIVAEAALSFLGLGMPVNQPSLGSLIRNGFDYILSGQWWITVIPAIVLIILILAINLLGDWLRDALNPKLYKETWLWRSLRVRGLEVEFPLRAARLKALRGVDFSLERASGSASSARAAPASRWRPMRSST